jgi:hypothetical protein
MNQKPPIHAAASAKAASTTAAAARTLKSAPIIGARLWLAAGGAAVRSTGSLMAPLTKPI